MATQLDAALNNIWQMRGVTGLALYWEGQTLFRQFPKEAGPEAGKSAGQHIMQMASTLASDGHRRQQIYFGYAGGGLLIINHENATLMLLLKDEEVLGYLSKIALAFLKEHLQEIQGANSLQMGGAPEPAAAAISTEWPAYLDSLARILSKVLGNTQASYLIKRILSQEGLTDAVNVPKDRYLDFGIKVVNEVPSRGKRSSLVDEVKTLVSTL